MKIVYMTTLISECDSSSDRSETSSPINQNEQTINQESENTETQEQDRNISIINSKAMYKCIQCSKCFKDPDVFILHQRTHTRSVEEKSQTNQHTLLANPILANLLERPESSRMNSGVFNTNNVNSIENQIMLALAANMENYLQNLDSIMTPLAFMDKESENDVPDNSDSQDADDRSMDCQNIDTEIKNESHIEDNKSIESDDAHLIIVENNVSQITYDSDENFYDTKKENCHKNVNKKCITDEDFENTIDIDEQKYEEKVNCELKNEKCDEIYNNCKIANDETIDEKENRSMGNIMRNYQENTLIGN